MSHPMAYRKISALIDGELKKREAHRVEAHVIACSSCQVLWVELVHLVRRIAKA